MPITTRAGCRLYWETDGSPSAPQLLLVRGLARSSRYWTGLRELLAPRFSLILVDNRGVGKSEGAFDNGRGERDDFRAALDFMAAKYPGVPLWAAGFSFGSNVALETGAVDDRVSVLIGIAPPVTRDNYDFTNTVATAKPKFFVQGSEDELCPLEGMWAFYGKLEEPKELVVIDAADHLFEGKAEEVGDALEDLLADFPGVQS